MTCVYLCHKQNLNSKIEYTTQILPDMLSLSPRICQCMRYFFVKRPKFLSAASNLRVEQNLVHLGRFIHFSQKVVGVTLKVWCTKIACIVRMVAETGANLAVLKINIIYYM